jgi:MFS family permease
VTVVRAIRPRQWLALFALSLPVVALSVDMNGVVVLLPTIGRDLEVSAATAGAIVTAASLAFAAPLLLIGRVADRVGARPVLLVGVVGFAVASAICAWSETFGMMMVGRSLQGVASACCFTTSLAAIDALFEGDDTQPMAVGIWGALGGIGGAMGPLVASVLADVWSWRAFFGVNVALLSVAFVLLVWLVPHLPFDRTRSVPVLTLLLLMFGIGFACAGIQHAAAGGWFNASTIGGIVIGGVFLVLVAVRRRGHEPLVAARVTTQPAFRLGTATATLSNWGSGVVMVLVPTALQLVRGVSVLEAGILFLAFSVPFALGGALSGFMIRVRTAPATLALGSAAMVIGMVAMAIVGPDGPLGSLLVTLAVTGFGNGIVYSAATSYALIDVDTPDAAEASAALSALRVLGLALAVAVSTSMMTTIDSQWPGGSWGLRVALVLAAVITGAGWVLARRSPVAAPGRR